MFSQRGVLNLAHNEHDIKEIKRRMCANRLNGLDSRWIDTGEIKKLVPIMKLIGNFIVSLIRKLTLDLFELFWIPIINIQNKLKLKVKLKNNFLKGNNIYF